MRYRVAFEKRFQSDGDESVLDPSSELDVYLADGVVASKAFVERFEPEALHSQEVLDEDDAFLGLAGSEIWEYDVVDQRATEFEDAIRNSQMVMEFEVVDETTIDADEAGSVALDDGSTRTSGASRETGPATQSIAGARGGDDGPGGEPTVDASAGANFPNRPYMDLDEVDEIANAGSGGIDDLNVVSAEDPSLGLTDIGNVGPDDWAANTGPTREPGRGIEFKDKRE
jgi:hypothetical protein